MKKSIIFLLLFTSSVLVNGQSIRFSFMASPQVSWFNTESNITENNGIKAGMKLGLQVDNFFATHYAFSSGAYLNSTGGKLRFSEKTAVKFKEMTDTIQAGGVLTYRIDYFSVPFGLKLTTREIGYSTFWVNLGANADVRFKTKADLSPDYKREIIQNEINLFGFSYYLGAGVKYSIGGHTALVGGITYRGGLNDVLANNRIKAVINSLTLEIGILF